MDIQSYRTLVFDCDGVLLNSNALKTESFAKVAQRFSSTAAQQLVDYHVRHGGISRYEKFRWFQREVLKTPECGEPQVAELVDAYAQTVSQGLLECEVAEGLETLRDALPESRWLVVSGSDQAELRWVFEQRSLAGLFDGGIFGSPDNKHEILAREKASGNIHGSTVMLGDSQYDAEAARLAGLAFIFVSGWSESSYAFPEAQGRIERLADLLRNRR